MSSSPAFRLLKLLLGDYNMLFSLGNFTASPVDMLLVLIFSAFFLGFTVRTVARRTLLPTVSRFLTEQKQQQQRELERQARLRSYLDGHRRRAMAVAAATERVQRLRADLAWLGEMEDNHCRHEEAIQAQEPVVAARQAEEYGLRLRRDLEIKLGRFEANDYQLEEAVAFTKQFDDEQHYQPAKDGLLYDSDDEGPQVVRGEKKGKTDE